MQVSDPLATGAPDMQSCSQLVDKQEASAIDAAPAVVPSDAEYAASLPRWLLSKNE